MLDAAAGTGRAPAATAAPERRRLPRADAPGSRDRDYWVHAPKRPLWRRALGRPAVLMVLHGCRQEPGEIIQATRFVEQAAASDVVLVFPSVTSWSPLPPRTRKCWGFWIPGERRRGSGEAGDLRRILAAVEAEFGTDPARRYVAGLSSGGAMAVAMAVAYGDAVRAAGAVAGLTYGETSAAVTAAAPSLCPWFLGDALPRPGPRLRPLDRLVREMADAHRRTGHENPVPLLVMQSTRDRVVRIENARMLRDVWIARHGGGQRPRRRRIPTGDGEAEHCCHLDSGGRTLVETVFYEGRAEEPTHYWPGDRDSPPFAYPDGPSATRTLMDFFRRHGL